MDTTDGKLEACLGGARLGLAIARGSLAGLGLAATLARHCRKFGLSWVSVVLVREMVVVEEQEGRVGTVLRGSGFISSRSWFKRGRAVATGDAETDASTTRDLVDGQSTRARAPCVRPGV